DEGYFTSSRPGGKGKDDIYSFKMPPLEFCYRATVYNFDTGAALTNAKVTVQGTDGKSYDLTTDANGGISLCEGEVLAETNFSVDVSLEGYIGTGDQFSTMGVTESTTYAREYFLKEIVINKAYDLPLVLYPFDKAELLINDQVNSADSLSYLYDLMTRNPNFVVQLESHTDTRGKAGYNQSLSQRRAETCVKYLISRGIEQDRLVAKGIGENQPIITDKQINAMATEEEQEKAHQVNRRTIFKILRFDYVPKTEEEGTKE
ncbi:MAG: OmpA family protein, partial [Flavobacteriales bacterium]